MNPLRWAVRPYRANFARPIATAHGLWSQREGFWVACRDADGVIGLGEVAPLPDWGTESRVAAETALAMLGTRQPDPLTHPAAHAGVETAILDGQARRAGVSLARFLDLGEPSTQVAVNALLKGDTPQDLALEVEGARRNGYRAFKLKVGARPLDVDVERVRAVREALGEGVELRLDANGGWSRDEASAALRRFAAWNPAYVEQPIAAEDRAGLAVVEAASGVRVAADEAVRDVHSARKLIHAGVSVLVLKPMAVGGLRAAADIARACRAAGVQLVLTSVLDRGVGTAAVLHLAAALGSEGPAGLDGHGLFAEGPALDGLAPLHGNLIVPQGPGLGLEVLADDLRELGQEWPHDSISLR